MMREELLWSESEIAVTYKPSEFHWGTGTGGVQGPQEGDKIGQLRALTPQINTSRVELAIK